MMLDSDRNRDLCRKHLWTYKKSKNMQKICTKFSQRGVSLPYSISRWAVSNRFCKLSGVSVFRSINRRLSSSIDGGNTNTNKGFRSDARICFTPSISMSNTHTFPTFCTLRTDCLLKKMEKTSKMSMSSGDCKWSPGQFLTIGNRIVSIANTNLF